MDYTHQDIVYSDPFEYKADKKIHVVMKHICALASIDLYPPKTGKYKYLKIFADAPAFAGTVDYHIDGKYDVNKIACGWVNFTTLRGDGKNLEEGKLFPTVTGLLPVQYDGLPICVHIVYQDGTHYVSKPFAMPSLSFGVENKMVVKDFELTDEPLHGLMGDCYGDPNAEEYPVI